MPLLEAWLKLQRKEESSLIQNQEGELAWKEATHIVVWNLVEFSHIEKCWFCEERSLRCGIFGKNRGKKFSNRPRGSPAGGGCIEKMSWYNDRFEKR